ncbi:hypothetical protein PT974_03852 [Cladobotryum mycophilum]|uniref:Uncharacterized protein n=1 Tax=Cladobotryum mycophilum TaxID=491253 RepID=A0ABR0SUM4_9HYPO
MWFIIVYALVQGAYALPAAQSSVSCPHDYLFTSLSRDAQDFCSTLIKTHCDDEFTTPTQFATYAETQLSSYCECVLTSCTWEVTVTDKATRTETGTEQATATSTTRPRSGTASSTDSTGQTRSSNGRSGSEQPTDTDSDTSSRTATSTGTTATETSSDDNDDSTSLLTIEPTSILVSGTQGRTGPEPTRGSSTDTGSVTGKVTQTESDSFTDTATSEASASTSFESTTTNSNSFTSGSSDGDSSPTQSPTGTSTGTQSSDSASSTPADNDPTSTAEDGETSSTSTGQSTGDPQATITSSWSSIFVSPVVNASSTGFANSSILSFTVINSRTQTLTLTSGEVSTTFTGWNLSTTEAPWGTGTQGPPTVTGTGATSTSGSSIWGSGSTTITPTGTWNFTTTSTTPTSPPFLTPSGFNTSTITGNATQTSYPSFPAANFTQVTRTGAIVKETCYQMPQPQGASTRRALLHNTNLRERNATIPFPYIESVDFQTDGIDPLYLTLRDAAEGTHYIDVSNRSYIAIVDSLYNAMILDAKGIHFSTKNCRYDVSITIKNMYEQLAKLSGEVCSAGGRKKRMSDMDFQQTVYIRDQCNNPVKRTVRKYPALKIGDTDCNDIEVDEATGRWLFDCTFPGSDSGTQRCQWAVRNDIEEFLFTDPFGGSCPDLSTVITTLEATGQDFINPESLRAELYNQGLDEKQKGEADLTVVYYEQLWEILKQAFSKLRTDTSGRLSAISEYIDIYDTYRNFEDDICDDLHAGDMPLKMSLRAGVTYVDALARLNWAPQNPKPYNVTIQDPSKQACCANGAVSRAGQTAGTCAYPASALIGDTGCLCGTTASGGSIAFEYTECDNFVSECEVDADCASAGHPSYVCLTGSCCGAGVCVDPYECSQNGTTLVRLGL